MGLAAPAIHLLIGKGNDTIFREELLAFFGIVYPEQDQRVVVRGANEGLQVFHVNPRVVDDLQHMGKAAGYIRHLYGQYLGGTGGKAILG